MPMPVIHTITLSQKQLSTLVTVIENDLDNNGTDLDLARLYGKLKDVEETGIEVSKRPF